MAKTGRHGGGTVPLTPTQHRKRGTQIKIDTDSVGPYFPDGMPIPPTELNDDALTEWERLAKMLFDQGMLTLADRGAFAVYCQAYADWQSATRALSALKQHDKTGEGLVMKGYRGQLVTNPLVRIAREAQGAVLKASMEFGMTPVSRQRLRSERVHEKKNVFTSNAR